MKDILMLCMFFLLMYSCSEKVITPNVSVEAPEWLSINYELINGTDGCWLVEKPRTQYLAAFIYINGDLTGSWCPTQGDTTQHYTRLIEYEEANVGDMLTVKLRNRIIYSEILKR